MTVKELIELIILESNEMLDEDDEYIPYVNHAIDTLSFFLASSGDSEMLVVADISDKQSVPSMFLGFVPKNGYPIYIQNGQFRLFDDGDTVYGVRYTEGKSHISSLMEDIPFKDMFVGCLTFIASYLIKKKLFIPVEYCSQDKAFVTELMSIIQAAKGGAL